MPVSKKRKKDGKPVKPHHPAEEAHASGEAHPEGKPLHQQQRGARPSNPFVARQTMSRGSQRGQ